MPNKTKLGRNVGPFHTNAFSFENEYILMSLDLPTALIRGGPVHTNAFSKVCVAVVIENALIDSRLHYRFDVFSTFHTKTFEIDRMGRWVRDVSWTLCASYKTRARDILQPTWHIWRHRFHFDAFSTVHTKTMFLPFRVDPLSTAFWSQCVLDENAQRISVDGMPIKRNEMYAFSNEISFSVGRGLMVYQNENAYISF